jgi:shikimate dehydrogenase
VSHLISKLIENELDINWSAKFAGIIGINPSKGARSPLLWNSAFTKMHMNERMYPMDIAPEFLTNLLCELNDAAQFIGGAVAVPYKEAVFNWLGKDRLSNNAIMIGAVNCLYRSNGILYGANTDGEGFLYSLKEKYPHFYDKKILVIGYGGAGKAVFHQLYQEIAIKKNIYLVNRDHRKIQNIISKTGLASVEFEELNCILPEVDIVINCTSVGGGGSKDTPISYEQMKLLRSEAFIFDINYSIDGQSGLLDLANKFKIRCSDGLRMNLIQAAIGFCFASGYTSSDYHSISLMMKG